MASNEYDQHHRQLWEVIHTYAANYPKKPSYVDKKMAVAWYHKIIDHLICETCKGHYKKSLETLCVKNRNHLFRWTVAMHNRVNERLGKRLISLKEAARIYKFDM